MRLHLLRIWLWPLWGDRAASAVLRGRRHLALPASHQPAVAQALSLRASRVALALADLPQAPADATSRRRRKSATSHLRVDHWTIPAKEAVGRSRCLQTTSSTRMRR